jgi:hypothetical protein
MDACAGLSGSAADVVRLLHAHPIVAAEPRQAKPVTVSVVGSLPGTYAVALQRPDGVIAAALFNQRVDESQLDYSLITPALEKALNAVEKWPAAAGGGEPRPQEPTAPPPPGSAAAGRGAPGEPGGG